MNELAGGDESAAAQIWKYYHERLVRLARKNLVEGRCRVADEDDVVLEAFNSFCRCVIEGRLPNLHHRDNLWKVLVTITVRKAWHQDRDQTAEIRGGGEVRGESVFARVDSSTPGAGINHIPSPDPRPEFAVMVVEKYESLMRSLGDDVLRQTARYKLEGYSNGEIAQRMKCSLRSVGRRLARIRRIWAEEIER